MFITRGEFGLPNYEAKDFSDLHDVYTIKEINTFIQETLTYVKLRYDASVPSDKEEGLPYDGIPF